MAPVPNLDPLHNDPKLRIPFGNCWGKPTSASGKSCIRITLNTSAHKCTELVGKMLKYVTKMRIKRYLLVQKYTKTC